MTVINEKIRLPSPTSADELVKIAQEGISAKPTILHTPGSVAKADKVQPLTIENLMDTCPLCIPNGEPRGCQAKQAWAVQNKVQKGIFGFIAYKKRKAVAAAEFLPTTLVPYPLPEKNSALAFITCIYPGEDTIDHRDQVLETLRDYLANRGYKALHVITGRRTPFPNGPVSFFLSHGFKELSEIDRVILREGEEELILMEKSL